MTGVLVAIVVVVEDVVVVVVARGAREGHDGRTETEYRHDRHRGDGGASQYYRHG